MRCPTKFVYFCLSAIPYFIYFGFWYCCKVLTFSSFAGTKCKVSVTIRTTMQWYKIRIRQKRSETYVWPKQNKSYKTELRSSKWKLKIFISHKYCCGCGAVGRAVAYDTRGPGFESSHRQLLLNIYLLLTVCRKDEYKEKEAGKGPFFLKKNVCILF